MSDTPDILQKVRVRTMSNEQCEMKIKLLDHGFKIKDYMICSFAPQKGFCHGDSGGPLVVRDQYGKYSLIGLVSFDFAGCANRNPYVLTRVSLFNEWIENNKCP